MDWKPRSEDITTILIFGVVFLILLNIRNRKKTNIPGPFAWPIIGNLPLLLKTPVPDTNKMLEQNAQKYGNFFRIHAGSFMYVFVSGFDNIHNIFVKNSDKFSDRPNHLPLLKNSLASKGVLWSNGEYWKKIRRFTLQTLRDFGVGKKSLEEIVEEEIKSVDAYFEKNQNTPITNTKQIMTTAVSNVIHSIVFGFRYPLEDATFRNLLSCMDSIVKLSNFLSISFTLPRWMLMLLSPTTTRTIMKSRTTIGNYIKTQREEHEKTFDAGNIRDFVDLHIQNTRERIDESYNDTTMAVVIQNLFGAGTETTATSLDWAFLYMIGYPDIQEKCYKEIQSVVGDSRMVKMSDRNQLVYVDATLMEIQRLANTVYTTLPHMATEDITVNGFQFPKGTVVLGLLASAHFDTKYWKDPHAFKPERFIGANGKLIKAESYVPFSLGPRVCLGESLAKMELFLVFSNLIQRFRFTRTHDKGEVNFTGVSGLTTAAPPHEISVVLR